MKPLHVALLTGLAVVLASAPAISQQEPNPQRINADLPNGGSLGTMPHGSYQCALPGDASGAAFSIQEDENFRIFTASRYEVNEGSGTYILRGDELTFTRGPKKGQRFERVGDNQLRQLDADGERSALLCTRLGSR